MAKEKQLVKACTLHSLVNLALMCCNRSYAEAIAVRHACRLLTSALLCLPRRLAGPTGMKAAEVKQCMERFLPAAGLSVCILPF